MKSLLANSFQNTEEAGGPAQDLAFATAVDAGVCGLSMYSDPNNKLNPKVGPLTALPSPWPKRTMEVAKFISPVMSVLMQQASQDMEWLKDCLDTGGVLASDPFMKSLTEIASRTQNACPVEVTLFRHDFMLHNEGEEVLHKTFKHVPIKNVEMNTVSVGLSYLADKTKGIHDRNINRLVSTGAWPSDLHAVAEVTNADETACCDYASTMREGLAAAEKLGLSQSGEFPSLAVMVTENVETNSIDQFGLWRCLSCGCNNQSTFVKRKFVPVQRTLQYLLAAFQTGRLRRIDDGRLVLDEMDSNGATTPKEICMVYWRVFYHPRHVEGPDYDAMMELREMIEGTTAIKIPSIPMQLAGSKEIQKRMASKKNLEKFLTKDLFENEAKREQAIALLMDCTAVQVDPLEDTELMNKVISTDKNHWVLKPQKEGGGNNLFGDDMVEKLKELKASDLGASGFVLMQLIKPPKHLVTIADIKQDGVGLRQFYGDSELGIYSTLAVLRPERETGSKKITTSASIPLASTTLGLDSQILPGNVVSSNTNGNILRTKPSDVREGGIHAGFGWLDSAILLDDNEWASIHENDKFN